MSDLIAKIKEHFPLHEYIARRRKVERQSNGRWRCLSPFRNEKTPSFDIYDDGKWHDYGTGETGDLIDYVERTEHVDNITAIRMLAEEAGLRSDGQYSRNVNSDPAAIADDVFMNKTFGRLTDAINYMHVRLPDSIRDQYCTKQYGFTAETVSRFKIGFEDGTLVSYMTETLKYTRSQCLKTGLFIPWGENGLKSFFEGRLVFPYLSRGRAVYAIARRTHLTADNEYEKAKYKKLRTGANSDGEGGDNNVSQFIRNEHFFNEDVARGNTGKLLITEGVTDCIAAVQAGIACFSPVTTKFRDKDIPKLIELTANAEEVVVCNDNDELADGARPGRDGALITVKALFEAGRNARIAELPRDGDVQKVDLCDFLKRPKGPDEFKKVLKNAKDLLAFELEQFDAKTGRVPSEAETDAMLLMAAKRDAVQRDVYLKRIAKVIGASQVALRKRLGELDPSTIDPDRRGPGRPPKSRSGSMPPRAPSMLPKAPSTPPPTGSSDGFDDDGGSVDEFKPVTGGGWNSPTSGVIDATSGISRQSDGYYRIVGEENPKIQKLCNFTFDPKCIMVSEDGTAIRGILNLHKENGQHNKIEHDLRRGGTDRSVGELPPRAVWNGTGNDFLELLRNLMSMDLPVKHAIAYAGYTEYEEKRWWVTKHHKITNHPEPESLAILKSQSEDSIGNRITYMPEVIGKDEIESFIKELSLVHQWVPPPLPKDKQKAEKQKAEINPHTAYCIMGWTWAAFIKPIVSKRNHKRFPFLMISGTYGSGKTAFVQEIVWPFCGISDGTNFSCSSTKLPIERTMSCSSSIPVWFDEFKQDMGQAKVESFERLLRRAYGCEDETRGRPDQSTYTITFRSPVIVTGESEPQDSALRERFVPVHMERHTHTPITKTAYQALTRMPLSALGHDLIQWIINCDDLEEKIDRYMELHQSTIRTHKIECSERIRYNMSIVGAGLHLYKDYCADKGVVFSFDIAGVYRAVSTRTFGGVEGRVASEMDRFLTTVYGMIANGDLKHGLHYARSANRAGGLAPSLYIKMDVTLIEYMGMCRKIGLIPIHEQLIRRSMRENNRSGGYVLDTQAVARFGSKPVKCIEIDQDKVSLELDLEPTLNFDDTPSYVSTYSTSDGRNN